MTQAGPTIQALHGRRTPVPRAQRCALFLLLCLILGGAGRAAENGAPSPCPLTLDLLKQVFVSNDGQPWIVDRDKGPFSRVLGAEGRGVFDLRGLGSLSVCASRESAGASVVRLRWLVKSRVGGLYMAGSAVNIPVGGPQAVAVDVSADSTDLTPVGHQRPWDNLAAAEVAALELRAECHFPAEPEGPASVKLALAKAYLEKDAAPARTPSILDLALHPPPAGSRAKAALTFRIEPPPRDPFAPEGEGDVRVILPGGRQALAFYDQQYVRVDDGYAKRDVAAGRPYWCAYLPEPPAAGALEIVSGARKWPFALENLALSGAPGPHAKAGPLAPDPLDGERWQVPLEIPLPEPQPPSAAAFAPWCLNTGQWEPASAAAAGCGGQLPQALWRPVPFWNASWGGFAGALRPDDALAQRMDRVLARAAAANRAQPLVVLDGEMFERRGTFNWDSHPLRGRLTGPGELFRSAQGVDFCRRWIRYCVARWGHSRAVSALWLTPVVNASGASEFHAQLAPLLQTWTRGLSLAVATLHPCPCVPQTIRTLGAFEPEEHSNWKVDKRLGAGHCTLVPKAGSDGASCLELEAEDTQATTLNLQMTYVTPVMDWLAEPPDQFTAADALQFDLWAPPAAPPDLRVGVHLRDRDGLWFETLLPQALQPGDWRIWTLDLTGGNSNGLRAAGHKKAWTDYSRQRLTEIGLHVYSTHPNWPPDAPRRLAVRLDNVRAVRLGLSGPTAPPTLTLLDADKAAPAQLHRGDLWERHLSVSKTFANPFDATQCDLAAILTAPSGKQVRLPAFFDSRCERREDKATGTEIVEPVGAEYFTVRYRAVEAGPHTVVFELREGGKYEITERTWQPDSRFTPDGRAQEASRSRWGQAAYQVRYPDGRRLVERVRFAPGPVTSTLKLPQPAFVVAPESRPGQEPFHGFIRVAQDKRHFEYDDGAFYYPLGPSLRSPSDRRIPYLDPKWSPTEIERLARRGTYQYDDYLTECQKAGINWARVWMCPWWCGLEWRRDWPGYQGCGRYNLLNAWRMDYLLEAAAQRNMSYEVCVTNHGQYSLYVDTDWPNNPYNAKLGGPLVAPSEFFTRADTQSALQNRLRYVVARYSHSPNVIAWGLLSEVEWLEEYEPSISSPDRPAPNVEAWHTNVAAFLKALDPNRHLITTHFARPVRGAPVLALPALDYASSNAYSFFDELGSGAYDAPAALADFWAGNTRGFKGFHIYGKPALVGEQGRHWLGGQYSTKLQLDADLHACLWSSVVQPLGGATGYWWWLHLHFDNRYGDYKAVAAFMQGEDMRPARNEALLQPTLLAVTSPESALRARALASDERMYVWVYHHLAPRGLSAPDVAGAVLKIGELKPGDYSVEFWDTDTGRPTEKREVTLKADGAQAAAASIPLPAVKRDLALKIKPRGRR